MKCLVTGASGLIGHELCRQLIEAEHDVWAVDNGFRGNLIPPNTVWLSGDIAKLLPSLPVDFDIVYHMAAINGTKFFYDIPNTLLKNNIECDLSVFAWAKTCPKLGSLVYASSSEIVSDSYLHYTPEETDVVIKNLHNPRWSYRLAKMVAENYLSNSSLPWIAVRYFNVYGAHSKAGHFVSDQMEKIHHNIFELIGADETRSFCFVEDAVAVTQKLPGAVNQKVINVGSDEEISILDAANTICQAMHKEIPNWKLLPGRSGSARTRVPNLSLLKTIVPDYCPRSFAQGVKEIVTTRVG